MYHHDDDLFVTSFLNEEENGWDMFLIYFFFFYYLNEINFSWRFSKGSCKVLFQSTDASLFFSTGRQTAGPQCNWQGMDEHTINVILLSRDGFQLKRDLKPNGPTNQKRIWPELGPIQFNLDGWHGCVLGNSDLSCTWMKKRKIWNATKSWIIR